MEQTGKYGLSQWDAEDRILREDFNADNAKIEAALANAGNCQIASGSYVGTGKSGSWSNANNLTFGFVPKLVIIRDNSTYQQVGVFTWNCNAAVHSSNSTYTAVYMTGSGVPMVKYEGNSMSWFSNNNAVKQMNDSGKTYRWIAIG